MDGATRGVEPVTHQHHYRVDVKWTGNLGTGTDGYRNYSRDHEIRIAGKPTLAGSSDPAFRGDAARHNPEDMLVPRCPPATCCRICIWPRRRVW